MSCVICLHSPTFLCLFTLNFFGRGNSFYFFFEKINLFLAALNLCCCPQAFSSFGKWGLLSRCSVWVSHFSGFSWWGVQAPGARASEAVDCRLSSCSWQAPEWGVSTAGAGALFPCGKWNPPRPRIKRVSSALAGRFLTTGPPGKVLPLYCWIKCYKMWMVSEVKYILNTSYILAIFCLLIYYALLFHI